MEKYKILLVSSAFYPEISPRSFRATELAKQFTREGHKVSVISKYRDFNYSEFLQEFPLNFKMWNKPVFPRLPNLKYKPFAFLCMGISRLLSLFFEYPEIEEMFEVKRMLKHESKYDFMISFAVPFTVHWGVAWARSMKNPISKSWVADCGDPYMYASLDTFKKPFYFKFLEVNFCRKCDYISVPFKEMQVQFYPEFISKITVIPQGFNFNEIRLYDGQMNNEKPIFIFAGSIIPGKRDLTLFLDFLSSLSTNFVFKVYTNQKNWFNKYKLALGEKLEVNGYIERLSLIYEMSKADFLVNIDSILDNTLSKVAVPSKLIDYALTNRPILNIYSAYLDKNLIQEFLNKNYSRQRIIEKSNYDIRKVSAKFLELL
jgi:hypothetical protein